EPKQNNTFWIAVSGYEVDRAYIVYRFFHDIGLIVGKSLKKTNIMYLKYLSVLDCEIALSYNGQRIGYGGDIRVMVKLENPVTKNYIIEALEKSCKNQREIPTPIDGSMWNSSINIEDETAAMDVKPPNKIDMEPVLEHHNEVKYKRAGLLQWFKEKLAYMFYFY
ncbi:hypothetical protein KR074_010824, partial [Drosophila pseudoananassae]